MAALGHIEKEIFPLETERLLLRPFTADDFEALLAIQSRADVARWLYWEPRGADEVRAHLDSRIAATALRDDGDRVCLAVVLKTSSEVIGDVSLFLHSAEHRQGEIGFIVHPDHHGRGYATEATRAAAEAGVRGRRPASRHRPARAEEHRVARVLERLGMRKEAHFVENEFVKGEWQSEAVYALLEREWRARGD